MSKNYELDEKCGKRLLECMEASNINGTQLAQKMNDYYNKHGLSSTMNISQQKISTIINGRVHLKKEDAELFAEILNVDVNYLLGNTDYKTPLDKVSDKFKTQLGIEKLYYQITELHGFEIIATASDLERVSKSPSFIRQWIIQDKQMTSTTLHHVNYNRARIIFLYDIKQKKLSPPILMADFEEMIKNIDYHFQCSLEKPFRDYQNLIKSAIPLKHK